VSYATGDIPEAKHLELARSESMVNYKLRTVGKTGDASEGGDGDAWDLAIHDVVASPLFRLQQIFYQMTPPLLVEAIFLQHH